MSWLPFHIESEYTVWSLPVLHVVRYNLFIFQAVVLVTFERIPKSRTAPRPSVLRLLYIEGSLATFRNDEIIAAIRTPIRPPYLS